MNKLLKRKPNRLSEYDYSQNGAYFITICTNNRKSILSHIVGAIHELPLQKKHTVISNIVGYLKMNSSKQIHKFDKDMKVWQRSYCDHIIRNETDYNEIWHYIENNPAKWYNDRGFIAIDKKIMHCEKSQCILFV